jgi:DNA repair protein RecO (recombination protein O)
VELRTEAFVFRMVDYREADRILALYTRDLGRVDVLARSARKSFKRFGGHLTQFARIEASIDHKEGRSLDPLRAARLLDPWPRLQQDLGRFAVASYVAELTLKVAPHAEPDPALWGLLVSTFLQLQGADAVGKGLVRLFEARLLAVLGHLPDLTSCSRCGAPLTVRAFSPQGSDGLYCDACRPLDRRSEPIAGATLLLLERGVAGEDVEVPGEALAELRELLDDAVARVAGRLQSLPFLRQML